MEAIKQEIFILTSQPQQGLGGLGKQGWSRKAEFPSVLNVVQSRRIKLERTCSWDGLDYLRQLDFFDNNNLGDNIIIGILDSGIWPESHSFNDDGYGPIPSRWKGTCEDGELFNASHCNRKIIGARWYEERDRTRDGEDILSARDCVGHGTMVASIIAGSPVQDVNHRVIRGVAPRARLAIYKVTWGEFADVHVILAAIDDCIKDGVDIINISLGIYDKLDPKYDISIATSNADVKGISIVCCAGNDDKFHQQIMNIAPWVITVAAATKSSSLSTNNRSLIAVDQPHGGSLRPGRGFRGLLTDPKIPSPTSLHQGSISQHPNLAGTYSHRELRCLQHIFLV